MNTTTRGHIIEAADRLFYQQGYSHTSFADIADAVRISRGNFYHHFKSKDEILGAVISFRRECTRGMLETWDLEEETPSARIRKFVDILILNSSKIKLYGCPVGTLCTELAKLNHPFQPESSAIFALFRNWLRAQFTQLGRSADADELAMHLLARSQGVATLASAFQDEEFITSEVGKIYEWLKAYE